MKLVETTKFQRLRKKIKEKQEIPAIKSAIVNILEHPESGKKLKGKFRELRSFSYTVKGQNRRLIFKTESDTLILMSFGPREVVYKKAL